MPDLRPVILAALVGAPTPPLPALAQQDGAAAGGPGASGPIVFGELMWMGSEASTADEWIELYNAGPTPVDLMGWCITRLVKGDHEVMVELGDTRIDPGGTFLIANYGPEEPRSRLAVQPDLVTTSVTLPNTRLQLRLVDGPPHSGGAVVDVADDGRGAPLAGSTSPRAAMVRVDLTADGSTSQAWATSTTSEGWKAGAVELGTPGTVPELRFGSSGTDRTTAVPPGPWGAVKLARSPR